MKVNKKSIYIGQKVYLEPIDTTYKGICEAVVTEIGRKYFYIQIENFYRLIAFDIADKQQKLERGNTQRYWNLYFSMDEVNK